MPSVHLIAVYDGDCIAQDCGSSCSLDAFVIWGEEPFKD
jgi:hypothetical protein